MDLGKVRLGAVDYLLMGFVIVYCISAAVNGNEVSSVVILDALPYMLLYCGTRIFVSIGRGWFCIYIVMMFSVWLCVESFIGLQQVFGYRSSGHTAFGMTGSFGNPGPFGGFVAIVLSLVAVFFIKTLKHLSCMSVIALRGLASVRFRNLHNSLYGRWLLFRFLPLILSGAALFLGMVVLPASASRAGWLAFGLSLLLYMLMETDWISRLFRSRICLIFVMAVAIVVSVGVFLMKKDSALGRLHIWNMEMIAIAEYPWIGTGPGTALGTYGKVQEQYFRSGNRNETVVRVAGCPEYAFNEYLKAGVEAGLPGLLIMVSVAVVSISGLLRRKSPFAYGLFAAALFAFFSYPFSMPSIVVTLIIFLAVAGTADRVGVPERRDWRQVVAGIVALAFVLAFVFIFYGKKSGHEDVEDRWQSARQMSSLEMYEEAVVAMEKLYPEMFWNYRYLYDYGYALHKMNRCRESNDILHKGAKISSDPMFHNIMGKNFRAMGQYDLAEREYITAHYMVPCRLYPLVLLFDLYEIMGCDTEALERKILSMPVNPKNRTMRELKEKIEEKSSAE